MPKLLYSARSADGQSTEGFVEAPSVDAALMQLERQGLCDVRMHQDLAAPQDETELQGLGSAQQRELARFKVRLMQAPGLKTVLGELARQLRWWLLADAVLLAYGVWRGQAMAIAAGVVGALLPFAIATWNFRHADRYRRLLQQFSVGNWDAVRVLANDLRSASRRRPEMDFDLDLRLAAIDAREHSLEDGLARIEPWRARWATRPGYFEMRVASVHLMAGDTAGYLALQARAHELSPGDASRAIDHAMAEARFGQPAVARRIVDDLDERQLPVHGRGFLLWLRGLLALQRRDPAAEPQLAQAVGELLRFQAHPVTWPALALCTCDHALALHAAGRTDSARAGIEQVWPILQVHATVPLLRMLETDGLLPGRAPKNI